MLPDRWLYEECSEVRSLAEQAVTVSSQGWAKGLLRPVGFAQCHQQPQHADSLDATSVVTLKTVA
jgi:hypothetical protein